MEMLIKETRNESFLRNHRNSLTKQLLNPNPTNVATTTNSTLLPLSRKKIIKNTNFDQAEFEKLISNTTNHNKINNFTSQTSSINIPKTDIDNNNNKTITTITNTIKCDSSAKLDIPNLEINNEAEEDEEDDLKKTKSLVNSGKKSYKNNKTKSSKTQKPIETTNNLINTTTSITTINNTNSNKKNLKKEKKTKKKSKNSANECRTCTDDTDMSVKTNVNCNDLISASKSNLFPKVTPHRETNFKSYKPSKPNVAAKPKEEPAPAPSLPVTPIQPVINESLRWDKRSDDPEKEAKRIELYKINRRKRYIEQRNKYLNLNSNQTRSSNLFSMYENDDYDSESTQVLNLNNEDTSSICETTTITAIKVETSNSLVSTSTNNISTHLMSSDIFNKLKLKERSNITDSAISSMSSNSR